MHATRIAYFVHDINDPAVARRVAMMRAAGGEPIVIGFRRDDRLPASVAGAPVVALGHTRDGDLKQRATAVLRALMRPSALLAAAGGAEVVIGRNLEALALAARVRRALPRARLVYECLDIHRTLLGSSAAARAIQWVEGRLLAAADLVIVSSPAFSREYFARRSMLTAPVLLVENKVLALSGPPPAAVAPPPGPPWTIGWFGNLRCHRTLTELGRLAARSDGRLRVLIAGRPSPAVFEDFTGTVAAMPHCSYVGPYTPADLPGLYAQCHFTWAIDWFEEGLNSRWLLPNRLYEACAFGSVPVALASVETGNWLARHGAGLRLADDDPAGQLGAALARLDGQGYAGLRDAVAAIPAADLVADQGECAGLMRAMTGA